MPADPYRADLSDLVAREDPVIYGSAPGPLTGSQLEAFERDGYSVLSERLPAEPMAELLEDARRITREVPHALVREHDRISIRSIRDPHRHGGAFAALAADPVLVEVARQIVGDVYLLGSRLDFKAALHGREFYWQSDFEVWHEEEGLCHMRAVTLGVLLSPSSVWNAPVMVVPGSHRVYVRSEPNTPTHDEPGPSRAAVAWLVRDGGIEILTGPAGTVVAMDSNLQRAAACNLSPQPGTVLWLSYNSVENRPSPLIDGSPTAPRSGPAR